MTDTEQKHKAERLELTNANLELTKLLAKSEARADKYFKDACAQLAKKENQSKANMQNAIMQGERVESAQLVIDDLAQQVAQQETLREEAERLRTVAQERAVELTTSNAQKTRRLEQTSRAREVLEEQVDHLVKRLEKRADCINDQTEQIHDLKARLQVCHAEREKLLNSNLRQCSTIDQLLETQARWDSACGILKAALVFVGVAAVLLSIVIPRL